jgi:hypothetical protein
LDGAFVGSFSASAEVEQLPWVYGYIGRVRSACLTFDRERVGWVLAIVEGRLWNVIIIKCLLFVVCEGDKSTKAAGPSYD